MDGKLGVIVGWVVCLAVVAAGWLVVGDEGMGSALAWLVGLSLVVVCVIVISERRVESGGPDIIIVPGDSGRPVTAVGNIAETVDAPAVQINRYGQTLDALAPLARPQVVASSGRAGVVEALGSMGAAQWYQDQADRSPWDLDGKPDEPIMKGADGPLLPRRSPRMTDYPLIAEVIGRTRSANEAIRVLWGSKDGKTLGWLTKVRELYGQEEFVTRGDIIAWELASGDDVADVAERLGVGVEEVQAVFDGR